ncbi:hypothetical protein [Bacillus pakistanensis]|nr:hypothetical protein [Bacillus pakistanensis]
MEDTFSFIHFILLAACFTVFVWMFEVLIPSKDEKEAKQEKE